MVKQELEEAQIPHKIPEQGIMIETLAAEDMVQIGEWIPERA